MNEELFYGAVKKKTDKGFGFITPDNGGKDVFFHAHDLVNVTFADIQEGDLVVFSVKQTDRGPKAINIELNK